VRLSHHLKRRTFQSINLKLKYNSSDMIHYDKNENIKVTSTFPNYTTSLKTKQIEIITPNTPHFTSLHPHCAISVYDLLTGRAGISPL
jgi:hypothetical protein